MAEYTACAWCGEIYETDDLTYEVDMGYLCDHCIRAIESRGEQLEFENDYLTR